MVDYYPIKLDIENVSRCNFRCTMCAVSDWHKGQRAADLSLEAFRQLIDESIRHGANYERAMANIALINNYARERGVDRTKMWTVVQQANLHELEALVDLAAVHGFSN